MYDRDDHPNDPSRGRAERGYEYDPLSDPLPAQPPSRGRRARPAPAPWSEQSQGTVGHGVRSTGEFGTPGHPQGSAGGEAPRPGRRRRSEPPDMPPRRFGAADALRGSRAARAGATRPEGSTGDPTQDALAALANLSGGPHTPDLSEDGAQPPPRGRRAHTSEEPGGHDPSFPHDDTDDEPRGRRSRRGRRARSAPVDDESVDTGFLPDEPAGRVEEERPRRRGRHKRGRRRSRVDEGSFLSEVPDETDVFDTGNFPGVSGPADTGAFPQISDEEPAGRRGRRRRAGEDEPSTGDSGAFLEQDSPVPEETPETFASSSGAQNSRNPDMGKNGKGDRRGRRGRRRRHAAEEEPERGSFEEDAPPAEEESVGRGRRHRRHEPVAREDVEEDPVEEDDEDDEPGLDEIAEAYGGSRRSRRKLKQAKRKAKKRGRRGNRRAMLALSLVLLLLIGGSGFFVVRNYVFPPDHTGEGHGELVFVIAEGESGSTIAQNLTDQGGVASVRAFTNALGALSQEELGDGLVPGTYSLSLEMSGESAVQALLDPDNRLGGRVSIPEGLRSEQVFELLAEETGLGEEELQEAYEQTDELNLPEYAVEGPAGYLFPATYRFEPETEALSALKTMVTQFRQVAEEMDLEGRSAEIDHDPNEVMAIASIVQAESGKTEDMPKVSRVVHNRLEADMPLQMDSTCFYAIDAYGIALTNEQLDECEADTSGFDTYHRSGLIPGPFVAPGQEAIEAALEPAEGEWLYFVATDPENGATEFTDSYEEFEELKQRFEENWSGE